MEGFTIMTDVKQVGESKDSKKRVYLVIVMAILIAAGLYVSFAHFGSGSTAPAKTVPASGANTGSLSSQGAVPSSPGNGTFKPTPANFNTAHNPFAPLVSSPSQTPNPAG
jgi:cytoskeletal protein RodZ